MGSDVKRYDIGFVSIDSDKSEMVESELGDYVLSADHEIALAAVWRDHEAACCVIDRYRAESVATSKLLAEARALLLNAAGPVIAYAQWSRRRRACLAKLREVARG